jgi:hypothetical protein
VLWFINMATYSPAEPSTAPPSRRPFETPQDRPYGPPQGERIREHIYEMLHLVQAWILPRLEDSRDKEP